MTRETFPKVKKGDMLSDGKRCYLYLRKQNVKEYDIHGRAFWINGF